LAGDLLTAVLKGARGQSHVVNWRERWAPAPREVSGLVARVPVRQDDAREMAARTVARAFPVPVTDKVRTPAPRRARSDHDRRPSGSSALGSGLVTAPTASPVCWVCGSPVNLVKGRIVCSRCGFRRDWSRLEGSAAPPAKTVLVIEDDPVMLRLEQSLLAKNGFAVDGAADGVKALEKVKTRRYDAVVLDIELPEMDGYEVATRIRELEMNRETPLIMVTASDDPDARKRGFGAGVMVFVKKPFTASNFHTMVQSAIS
jgi:CheY-like chemotaxis protein